MLMRTPAALAKSDILWLKRGFGLGMGAQVVSQIVGIGVQLGVIPLLIRTWGASTLGAWLVISAVPTYLNLSNFGFTQVAANEMTSSRSAGDLVRAERILDSIAALLIISLAVFAPLFVALVWFSPLLDHLKLGLVTPYDAKLTMTFLTGTVALAQMQGVLGAYLQSTRRFHQGVLWIAAVRASEAVALVAMAMAGGSLPECAAASLGGRAVMTALNLLALRRDQSFTIDARRASKLEIRRLAVPSFSYMLVPAASALILQGPLLVLSSVLGAVSVAVFSVTRTVTRIGFQFMNMVNSAATPEYAAARGHMAEFRKTIRYHLGFSAMLAVAYVVGFTVAGRQIVALYGHKAVSPSGMLLLLLAAAVAFEFMWNSGLTALVAINRHARIASYGLALAVVAIIAGYLMTRLAGVEGMAASTAAYNAAMLVAIAFALAREVPAARQVG